MSTETAAATATTTTTKPGDLSATAFAAEHARWYEHTIPPLVLTDDEQALLTAFREAVEKEILARGLTVLPSCPITGTWRDTYAKFRRLTKIDIPAELVQPPARLVPAAGASNEQHLAAAKASPEWNEHTMRRFLRARKNRVEDAVPLYVSYLHARVIYGLDEFVHVKAMQFPFYDLFWKFYPVRFHGLPASGRPLLLEHIGGINVLSWLRHVPFEVNVLSYLWYKELMLRARRTACALHNVPESVADVVIDLQGLSMRHLKGLKILQAFTWMDAHMTPETLLTIYIVRAPSIFPIVWKVATPFVDKDVLKKIRIFSSGFEETLRKELGTTCVPKMYNGACECASAGGECNPVPAGVDAETEGGEEVEQIEQRLVQAKGAGVSLHESVTVTAGKTHTMELRVEAVAGAAASGGTDESAAAAVDASTERRVWWSFSVAAKDIDFTVTWVPSSGAADEHLTLVHTTRVQANAETPFVRGLATLPYEAGKVMLAWSNSFSMWSSKSVSVAAGVDVVRIGADALAQDAEEVTASADVPAPADAPADAASASASVTEEASASASASE